MHPEVASKLPELERLCREHSVKRLELFGSAANGHFEDGRSDFDFLVEFLPVPRHGFSDVYFKLHIALQKLFERPIDLIETTIISNPYFRASVDRDKVPLYAAA